MGTLLSILSAVSALLMGSPIFLGVLLAGVLLFLLALGENPASIPHVLFLSMDKLTFMAIPFFIFAGALMSEGGMSARLIRLVNAFFGHLPGGMALSVVITTTLFAAMTGSTPATVAAIGSIMFKPMEELGYDRKFVIGLIASAGTLGILIPPSVPMLIYAGMTEESASALFMAGVVPGLLLAVLLAVVAVVWSKKKGYYSAERVAWPERWAALRDGIWVLGVPVIILGGIYGGIFTPTESAAIAVVYVLLISGIVYRELSWNKLFDSLKSTTMTTTMIMAIVSTAVLLGHGLTSLQVPQTLSNFITDHINNTILLLLLINVMYIIMGLFLDGIALIAITVPIFYPILTELGISGIHFAIMLIVNIELAVITPPIGVNLYVIQGISKSPIEDVIKGVAPFVLVILLFLLIVTYIPALSTILPSILQY